MAEKMMPYALRMTLAVLANKPDECPQHFCRVRQRNDQRVDERCKPV